MKVNLRKAACGKECQVRLAGICNFNAETTVLAHIRMAGITGGAQKAPDLLGAWCCDACHAECDRRTRILESEYVAKCFLDGVIRTQYELIKDGVVKW